MKTEHNIRKKSSNRITGRILAIENWLSVGLAALLPVAGCNKEASNTPPTTGTTPIVSNNPPETNLLSNVPPSPEPSIRRTPHLDVSRELPLKAGTEFDAIVYADNSAPHSEETSEQIVLPAPPETTEFPVRVWIATSRHFIIDDQPLKTLLIRRNEEKSEPISFHLHVKSDLTNVSGAVICAYFDYQGRACGKVQRRLKIVTGLSIQEPADALADTPSQGGIQIPRSQKISDLTITIVNPSQDLQHFRCCVSTPWLPAYTNGITADWNLPSASGQFVAQSMNDFTSGNKSEEERFASLKGAGIIFFKKAPIIFQKAFWELIDSNVPLKTISIVSEEPYIPWELMIPSRTSPAFERWPIPIGAAFAVGRWIPSNNISAAQCIPLSNSYVVAPEYATPLPYASNESAFVTAQFPGVVISPANLTNLDTTLMHGKATLLHFVCHGSSDIQPGEQSLYLDGEKTLDSIQLQGLDGFANFCHENKPLVFLNACEVGRQVPALTGVGGFSPVFIDFGASGVIAPLWSVEDKTAYSVAQEFYQEIAKDPKRSFADILKTVRSNAYVGPSQGDDTYAAYCFYGDPYASQTGP